LPLDLLQIDGYVLQLAAEKLEAFVRSKMDPELRNNLFQELCVRHFVLNVRSKLDILVEDQLEPLLIAFLLSFQLFNVQKQLNNVSANDMDYYLRIRKYFYVIYDKF